MHRRLCPMPSSGTSTGTTSTTREYNRHLFHRLRAQRTRVISILSLRVLRRCLHLCSLVCGPVQSCHFLGNFADNKSSSFASHARRVPWFLLLCRFCLVVRHFLIPWAFCFGENAVVICSCVLAYSATGPAASRRAGLRRLTSMVLFA